MTALELLHAARSRLDDFGGDTAQDYWLEDDSGCLWKNEELLGYLHAAQNEYCRRRPLRDASSPLCFIQLAPGVADYPLDPRILSVESVTLDSEARPLEKVFQDDLERRGQAVGVRFYQEDIGEHLLRVHAAPAHEEGLRLIVRRLPLAAPTLASETLEVPAHHQMDLLYWVCHLAYLKNDTETLNYDQAAMYRARFEEAVGVPRDAKTERLVKDIANARLRVTSWYR